MGSKAAAQLSEAAAIAVELGVRHPDLADRFCSLAAQLNELANTQLAGRPIALPLTAPIRRNALNLKEASGDGFCAGIRSLEEQVANLHKRAGGWERIAGD